MSNKASPKAFTTPEGVAEGAPPSAESPHGVMRAVALLLVRHEIRNLRRWFEEFDRDILLPILLGEIALHNIGAFENGGKPAAAAGAPAAHEAVEDDGLTLEACSFRPCNAYSIAAATGLPRETVRRKIGRLVELGWVTRRDNGHLFVTSAALEHFGSLLNARELTELIDTADCVRKLIAGSVHERSPR